MIREELTEYINQGVLIRNFNTFYVVSPHRFVHQGVDIYSIEYEGDKCTLRSDSESFCSEVLPQYVPNTKRDVL